jgi:hypothetical protein
VFDPERDLDPGPRRFYLRLLVVFAISAAGCIALWPSVTGFSAGADHQTGCLAITNGWRADKSGPTAAEIREINATYPVSPTAAQRTDPAFMARFRSQLQAAEASPAMQKAVAYQDWVGGSGACVRESRHRLIETGIGLGALCVITITVSIVRRTRRNLRYVRKSLAA